jgi:FMN-dependent NADH-azoreductase
MPTLLYVNACVKREIPSRTNRLAQAYLKKRLETRSWTLQTVTLEEEDLTPLTGKGLAEREDAIRKGDFSGETFRLARSFAAADEVVIAAPYWDMSFPALLKLYIEHLCVNRLTFCYGDTGRPQGLVHVKKLVYVTTSGGPIGAANFGFDYVKGICSTLFGITDISFFSAEGLDIDGHDPEAILAQAIDRITADADAENSSPRPA